MPENPQPAPYPHRVLVGAMLGLAGILTFVAIFSFWVNRQAMNTDNWTNTSGKLLQNEAIRSQLSTFLVTQLYANVDVQAELEKALPSQAQALAAPAAGGLRQLAQQVAERALATPAVQGLWETANRGAHEQLLKILDGGGSFVSTGEGEVTLQLGALVEQVGQQVGLPGGLAEKLPAEAGQLKVLDSEQLGTAQQIAKVIRKLPVVLTLLLILLYGGAIYLARGRRRRAVRATGFAFILAGVLALLVRGFAGTTVTDSLAASASVKPAVEAAWEIGTSLLVTVAVSAIAFGVLAVIGAWLAGPTRPATALRRSAAPYFRDDRYAAYGVAFAVWLALIAWAPVAAFHKPFGILLFAALFAAGTELLRRQSMREFPDAPRVNLGAQLTALIPRRTPASANGSSAIDELERLSKLHREGALTDAEFEAQKALVLRQPSSDGGSVPTAAP